MQHVFAMKQYLPEGQQARKQIYPRTMVKANGTEVKTTSVPLAFRTKHLVFFGDFFSRIVKTALAKRTTTTKAMIPPTKDSDLPHLICLKIGLGLNNLYPQTLRMLTVDHPRLVK